MNSGLLTKLSKQENLAFLFIFLYLLFSIIWHFSTNAPWDDDCVSRYYNAKNAINDPSEFIDRWNRPLFILLFFIPFQISKHLILLMALMSASASYALFKACSKLKFANAYLVVPLVLFQAFYFTVSRSSLAEPLAAIIISFGLYALVEKRFLAFAILGSLLPLARLELSLFLVIWGYILIKNGYWKYIFVLGIPVVLWNFAGTLIEGDLLWIYNNTIGTDNGTNRYGHTTFGHYFQRYVFVTGPVVFYFFIIGLFERLIKKKVDAFVLVQFVFGFLIYVLFSWKLSLGQAAGFLRHLIALGPLAAIICLHGYNYWIDSIVGAKEDTVPIDAAKDQNRLTLKEEYESKIAQIKKKEEVGELKRRKARHLLSIEEKKYHEQINLKQDEKKEKPKKKSLLFSPKANVILLSSAMIAVALFFFSKKLRLHHIISDIDNYKIPILLGVISLVYILLNLVGKRLLNGVVKIGLSLIFAFGVMSYTLITEPPNAHNSSEREQVTRIADIYFNCYLSKYDTYVNHNWFSWAGDADRERFKILNKENINAAKDSSIVIWETHYSNRIRGDIPFDFISKHPDYVELVKLPSDNFGFNVIIYQKLTGHKSKKERLPAHDKFVASTPDVADVYLSRARLKANDLKDLDGALVDCNRAIELNSLNPSAHFELGNVLFLNKQYKESQDAYKEVQEIVPDYNLGYHNAGVCSMLMNDFEGAVESFSKAIDKNGKYQLSFMERGKAYDKLKKYQEAYDDFTKSIELNGKDKIAYYCRGIVAYRLGKPDLACQDFSKSKQLGNKDLDELLAKYCPKK